VARYLLISSRDPFDSADTNAYYELAAGLAREGNEVAVFLVQNGVLTARPGANAALEPLTDANIPIRADSFSLQERGIPGDGLAPGVRSAPLDLVVDEMAGGVKVIWH
jgi:sulfur relay (sulfurtransferase) complex TusBCD TusD component (DsrE family)